MDFLIGSKGGALQRRSSTRYVRNPIRKGELFEQKPALRGEAGVRLGGVTEKSALRGGGKSEPQGRALGVEASAQPAVKAEA